MPPCSTVRWSTTGLVGSQLPGDIMSSHWRAAKATMFS
jgi:hypothetical protein